MTWAASAWSRERTHVPAAPGAAATQQRNAATRQASWRARHPCMLSMCNRRQRLREASPPCPAAPAPQLLLAVDGGAHLCRILQAPHILLLAARAARLPPLRRLERSDHRAGRREVRRGSCYSCAPAAWQRWSMHVQRQQARAAAGTLQAALEGAHRPGRCGRRPQEVLSALKSLPAELQAARYACKLRERGRAEVAPARVWDGWQARRRAALEEPQ